MKMIIEQVQNGFLVKTIAEDEVTRVVFEIDSALCSDNMVEEVDTMIDLLRYINDQIGPSTSRYSAARVRVSSEPGDKWVDANCVEAHEELENCE